MRILLLLLALLCGCNSTTSRWNRLPSIPDPEGFAGAFAGVSHGALIVAGGANFPDAKPWEGGRKLWYDTAFILDKPGGTWKVAGKLPRPLGYGVSVTHGNAMIRVGGSDANRHYADAFRLEWIAGQLISTPLPPLPSPIANASGAMVGDTLYVAGGLDRPDAKSTLTSIYTLDLRTDNPAWQRIESWPGPGRMLAVAAGHAGAFWLAGGVDLAIGPGGQPRRTYLKDAYRHVPGQGWQRLADLPYPLAASPSPAPADASGFWILGGDDGSQIAVAPDQHRGFNHQVLRYDARADRWISSGSLPAAHVTTPCIIWHGLWVLPGGEIRPGIRSPRVWARKSLAQEQP